jgi:hypothetical protein
MALGSQGWSGRNGASLSTFGRRKLRVKARGGPLALPLLPANRTRSAPLDRPAAPRHARRRSRCIFREMPRACVCIWVCGRGRVPEAHASAEINGTSLWRTIQPLQLSSSEARAFTAVDAHSARTHSLAHAHSHTRICVVPVHSGERTHKHASMRKLGAGVGLEQICFDISAPQRAARAMVRAPLQAHGTAAGVESSQTSHRHTRKAAADSGPVCSGSVRAVRMGA